MTLARTNFGAAFMPRNNRNAGPGPHGWPETTVAEA